MQRSPFTPRFRCNAQDALVLAQLPASARAALVLHTPSSARTFICINFQPDATLVHVAQGRVV
jgi:hypothetical protein